MKTQFKAIFAIGFLGFLISSAQASVSSIDLEGSRVSAAQLNQLDLMDDGVATMLGEIRQLATQIGQDTSEKSHVMTGVGQMEDEAIRLADKSRHLRTISDASMDEVLINHAYNECSEIELEISDVRDHLLELKTSLSK